MKARIERLRAEMREHEEAAYLITEGKNRRYLSGFSGSSGWLLVTPQQTVLLTDGRYWDQVARQCPETELFRYTTTEHKTLSGALTRLLSEQLTLPEGSTVAVEIDDLPVSSYRTIRSALEVSGFKVSDAEGRLKRHRSQKDEQELASLRRAAAIADAALGAAFARLKPGMTEAAWKAEIDYQVLLHGGEGAAFPTIVASGINGSLPHAGASEKVIANGELVTIDFGAIWNGYNSDMTRTVWFGDLSDHDSRLVTEVLAAQAAAVAAARPGMTSGDLDRVARDHLRQADLEKYFIHSLGHGVGLDVHETPTLRAGHSDLLSAGQVVTIEPGVYLPGRTGCRIEDTIVLTPEGCEVLNKFPKQQPGDSCPPLATS
jgi:Xaa-Pro aminopeptidase